jgi:hypothetical protein
MIKRAKRLNRKQYPPISIFQSVSFILFSLIKLHCLSNLKCCLQFAFIHYNSLSFLMGYFLYESSYLFICVSFSFYPLRERQIERDNSHSKFSVICATLQNRQTAHTRFNSIIQKFKSSHIWQFETQKPISEMCFLSFLSVCLSVFISLVTPAMHTVEVCSLLN